MNNLVLVNWIENDIVEVWLNRPEARNAYTKSFLHQFIKIILSLKKHKQLKVCILRAKGNDFCAGGDIKSMLRQDDLFQGPSNVLEKTYKKYIQKLTLVLEEVNFLTIAVVNGGAVGAGTGLALACDLVWCLPDAYFKLPFFSLGLVPADGSFWRLQRKVGQSKAMDILLRSTKIKAISALDLGIADLIISEKNILKNLAELKTQLFSKNEWSKIVLILRKSKHISLDQHLLQMRKIQSKLQLKKKHIQAIKEILK